MTQTHDYGYRLIVPGGYAHCRVRIFHGEAGQNLCLTTQRQDKFGGTALSDGAAQLATLVEGWHPSSPAQRFTWVEQYEYPLDNEPHGARETFAVVGFDRDADGSLSHPTWQPSDRVAVEGLIGQRLGA